VDPQEEPPREPIISRRPKMESVLGISPADILYDMMRQEKVYCRPGMDCHAEFTEGIPKGKRIQISTQDPQAKTLDEWATDARLSVSTLIEHVANATPVTKRKEAGIKEIEDYRGWEAEPIDEPTETPKEETKAVLVCPKCGAPVEIRRGRYGAFYGCTKYPRCKGTLSMKQVANGSGRPEKAIIKKEPGKVQRKPPRRVDGPPRKPPQKPPTINKGPRKRESKPPNWGWVLLLVAAVLLAISNGPTHWVFWIGIALGVFQILRMISASPATPKPMQQPILELTKDKEFGIGLSVPNEAPTRMETLNKRLHSWRFWLVFGSILVSTMGMVGFTEFMYEEALQQSGFGAFVLKSGGLASAAYEQAEQTDKMIDSMERFTNAFGWISPLNWHAYKMYCKAARQNTAAIKLWATSQDPTLAKNIPTSKVVAVTDGDTLLLETGEEIRLAGIDAPEWYETGGPEATQFLRDLVLGKVVEIKRIETGYYGRVIAEISINGRDAGALLCREGLARSLASVQVPSVDGKEGVVTYVESVRELDGGYVLLTGSPVDVFVLPEAVPGLDKLALRGATIEAIGKLKMYRGEPEVIVDNADNIRIISSLAAYETERGS